MNLENTPNDLNENNLEPKPEVESNENTMTNPASIEEVAPNQEEIQSTDETGHTEVTPEDGINQNEITSEKNEKLDSAIKKERLYSDNELIQYAEQWCEIDEEGNIRQVDGKLFKGKIIGKIFNRANPTPLKKFAQKYYKLSNSVSDLIKEFERSDKKLGFIGRINALKDNITFSDGIGDFDSLLEKIKKIEDKIVEIKENNYTKKENLLTEALSLKDSTDWKKTADRLKKLQEDWKKIGPVPSDKSDNIWNEFRGAIDIFFNNRQKFFESRKEEENKNLLIKQQLCEEVEKLLETDDFDSATKRVKEIQIEWNKVGFVPRNYTDMIWQRFREACDQVFNLARSERDKKKVEIQYKQEERKKRLKEVLHRYIEKEKNLIASIKRDEENIERWLEMKGRIKVSENSQEFLVNLENKTKDVQDKLNQKKERLLEVQKEIEDLQTKVKNQKE